MGGADKALLTLGGETLAARAARRLAPQVDGLAVSANGDPGRFAALGLPVLRDLSQDRRGPMGGIEAGLAHARAQGAAAIVTVAVDTPFFPDDLVARLVAAAGPGLRPALAASGDGLHPTLALWPARLLETVSQRIASGDLRLRGLAEAAGAAVATFPDDAAFFNVNLPADLAAAEARAAGE